MKNQLFLFLMGFSLFIVLTGNACGPKAEQAAEQAADGGGQYRQMKGKLADKAITLNVCQRLRRDYENVEQTFYYGYYYYDAIQNPIFVEGTIDSTGQLTLNEFSDPEKEIHFIGTMAADMSKFEGSWQDGQRQFSFNLKAVPEGLAIAFDNPVLTRSEKYRSGDPNSPEASSSLSVLWPRNVKDDALSAFLRTEFTRGMLGDSSATVPIEAEDLLKKIETSFFDDYLAGMKEMDADTMTFSEDNTYSYSYSQDMDMAVIWNDTKLLSVTYFVYSFTGGAHGNYGSGLISYDLANRKTIGLEDVFKPGFEDKLNAALDKAVRAYFKLGPNAPLSDALFEDEIAYNDNYCLTGKGILFNYVPYEIGPYAAGEIRLFVPFADIASVVQDRWLK